MKKKWIIALSVILGVVILIIILAFTVFSLKSVEIDFRTSKSYITATDEEIIESGEFSYGSSVFFHGKKKYEERLESKYPYLKVINIETVFPSRFIVHVAERQEVFALSHNGQVYICDEEFKVLRIESSFTSDQTNPILLEGALVRGDYYAVGEFMDVESFPPIYSALYENNRPLGEQISLIESINLEQIYDDNINQTQPALALKFFNGQTYKIYNCTYGLTYKVRLMLEVFSQIYTYIGKTITIDGGEVVLTEENLKTATIEIRNYYDYREHGEEDCYFEIIPAI